MKDVKVKEVQTGYRKIVTMSRLVQTVVCDAEGYVKYLDSHMEPRKAEVDKYGNVIRWLS